MSKRFPPWIVGPTLIVVVLASIWLLGKAQMSGSSAVVTAETPAPVDAEGDPSPTPGPKSFPDFSGSTLEGHSIRLADLKGKVVLVNLWATWCGPCRMEIPDLILLQKKYGARGFTIIGLSEDDDATKPAAFVKQAGINYPVMLTPAALHSQLQVEGLPTSFLLDRKGLIVKTISGIYPGVSTADLWSPEIEKVL